MGKKGKKKSSSSSYLLSLSFSLPSFFFHFSPFLNELYKLAAATRSIFWCMEQQLHSIRNDSLETFEQCTCKYKKVGFELRGLKNIHLSEMLQEKLVH